MSHDWKTCSCEPDDCPTMKRILAAFANDFDRATPPPMHAYLLKSGEILYPKRAEGEDGAVGDGWDLAGKESAEFELWDRFTVPAPPDVEELAADLRARRAAGDVEA